jgi:hypothetical protein
MILKVKSLVSTTYLYPPQSKYNNRLCWLNAEMEERGKEREKKRVVSLQPTWAQESRKSVRQTSGPYINSEELTTIWVD